jgi:hypothetical protein
MGGDGTYGIVPHGIRCADPLPMLYSSCTSPSRSFKVTSRHIRFFAPFGVRTCLSCVAWMPKRGQIGRQEIVVAGIADCRRSAPRARLLFHLARSIRRWHSHLR